jgi:alkylation response protein AidB-like acyl-CoA dehydrogenase
VRPAETDPLRGNAPAISAHHVPDVAPAALLRTPEQEELAGIVRRLLASASTPSDVRRQLGSARGYDERLWDRLARELGIQGLVIPEQYGGGGFSFADLAVVLEEAGRALLPAPLLSTAVLAVTVLLASGDDQAASRLLPGIAQGHLTATVTGTHGGARDPLTAAGGGTTWTVSGSADFVLDGEAADIVLVAADAPAGPTMFAIDRCDQVTRSRREVLDGTRRQALLTFAAAPAVPVGEPGAAPDIMTAALNAGLAGLAAEQAGVARHALDATLAYVRDRRQFGRPIGSFQAVKHRLADLLVAVEAARAASAYATACVSDGLADQEVAVLTASVACSQASRLAVAEYLQLHGGIGFTWEHPAHLYLRRACASEVLFGTPAAHRARLADLLGLGGPR